MSIGCGADRWAERGAAAMDVNPSCSETTSLAK